MAQNLARTIRVAILFVAFLVLFVPTASQAASLKIGGTGSALGGMQLLLNEFQKLHPEITGEILFGMGGKGGIRAVAAGKIDLSISSRPLKDTEQKLGLKSAIYAETAMVFATPLTNDITGLSTEELVNIFTGVKRHWANGTDIRIVLRPETEGDVVLLKKAVPEMVEAWRVAANVRGIPVAYTDQMSVEMIQEFSGGLGMTTLAQIYSENCTLKALSLNNSAPTLETISNGSYPIIKKLYFVTSADSPDLAQEFIAFARSSEGVVILQKSGHLSVGKKKD